MAVAFRSSTTQSGSGSGTNTNHVANKPAGVVDGDILIQGWCTDGSSTGLMTTVPTGWTQFALSPIQNATPDGQKFQFFWKVASGEPASWTWVSQLSSGNNYTGYCIAVSGADASTWNNGSNPGSSTASNASPVTLTVTTFTTTVNGCLLLWIAGGDPDTANTGTWTDPSGFTAGVQSYSNFAPFTFSYKSQVTAGATGSVTNTLTFSGGNAGWGAALFAIAPTSSGGSTTTKTLTDTMTLADANVWWRRLPRIQPDALTLMDDPNRTIQMIIDDQTILPVDEEIDFLRLVRQQSDTIALTDGFVSWRRLARLQQDSLTLLDGFTKSVSGSGTVFARVLSDTVTLADGIVDWLRFKRVLTDNADLLDGFSKIIAGAGITYIKILSDSTTLIDDTGQRWVLRKSQLTDTIGLSDALLRALARIRLMGENIEVTDGTIRFLRAVRVPTDTLDLSDELIRAYFADQIFAVAIRFGTSDPFRMAHSEPLRFGGH